MNEDDNQTMTLAPGTVALVETWLQSQRALEPPVADTPNLETMVAYLDSALSQEAAQGVVRGLTCSPEARRTLVEARRSLQGLQSRSRDEVISLAAGTDFTAQVARAWLALGVERGGDVETAEARWRLQGWDVMRRQVREGMVGAQVAWTAFLTFADRLKAELLTPRLALMRGELAGRVGVSGPVPAKVRLVILEAEVRSDGALYVLVSAQNADDSPSNSLAGETIRLGLRADGRTWAIAIGQFEEDRAEWTLDGFGAMLGFSPMSLPPEALHLTVGK